MRRALSVVVLVLTLAFAWWWSSRDSAARNRAKSDAAPANANASAGAAPALADHSGTAAADGPSRTTASTRAASPAAVATAFDFAALAENFPIVAPLNRPDSTITRDLDTLSQVFDAWRTNFPREGNPVGENADITAALTGENPHGFALIPKNHPAINAEGELCDRWGTPFRFHQLSGERMEIRSAGPDRKFATADDAVWAPQ